MTSSSSLAGVAVAEYSSSPGKARPSWVISGRRLPMPGLPELKFEVANITGERDPFAHAVGAMGFNVLRAVMDLVENPPAVNPYTTLKGRLVLAHQLTPVQKATKCLQVVAGNNQRPSEVLASLMEFCPPSLGPPSR